MENVPCDSVSGEQDLLLLDALPDHIALLDSGGVIRAVNATWTQFASANGSAGANALSGIGVGVDYPAMCDVAQGESAEGAAEAAEGIRSVLGRRRALHVQEYPCHAPDRQRWFRMTVLPIDRGGVEAMVIHTDITARKLEELQRRDSEMRLQLALDATGDGIWDWNPKTGQVYLSPGYYAMTGYRPEDEPGSLEFFQRLVHPDDWPQVMATIGAHLRGETAASLVEYRLLRVNGEVRWISGRGRVVERDAAGEPVRMIGLVTDITALKRIEHALQESELRYRAVVEDQTEIIGRIAADGTILFANAVYLRFFDKRAEDVIGRKWHPVAHPDDLPMIEARLAELTSERPVAVIENRVLGADGKWHWMQFVNRGRFDEGGTLREIQAVGRDVTERHELEAQQRQLLDENLRLSRVLMRLQEKERAALATELHDELSQQLVAIRAYAGAIRRRVADPGDRTHADAQAIESAAGDIYAISHRLMEGLRPQALDSGGLVAAISGLVAHWSRTRPMATIRLRAAAIGPCGAEVRINLFRIVQECLANSFAHGNPHRVRIFVGEGRAGPERCLRVVVRDDGTGLRQDPARSGYGLILMRERAQSLGGRFDLQSQPGRGLRVAVEVPLPA